MIDSSLFGVDIPAGTYAVGDMVQLKAVSGPANVRSGRGAAFLKRITTGTLLNASGSDSLWYVHVKNSDWIDPTISITASLREPTVLDEKNGCNQRGHDCPLTPNSAWEVYAVCARATTTTVANSVYALIDVDYPSVSSIIDPDTLPGIPASIKDERASTTTNAAGTLTTASFEVHNVDIFKAGFEYALEKIESTGSPGYCGFISISNAAGMSGLKRIIPTVTSSQNIKSKIEYASKLVKGPMDIGYLLFDPAGTGGTTTAETVLDFVKRRV